MKGLALLSSLCLIVCACGSSSPKGESANTTAATEEASGPTEMHRHFEDVNAVQQALVAGNLDKAKTLAARMREGFAGEAPTGWKPFVERSVASAEMMEVATDLGVAARLAGTMARTCGDCHVAQGVQALSAGEQDPPAPEEDSVTDFMVRHRWAADRMWEGLIGPSDPAWQAGATVLASTKLETRDVAERMTITPEVEHLLGQMHLAAQSALETTDPKQRELLYGNFLASCAGCHKTMLEGMD